MEEEPLLLQRLVIIHGEIHILNTVISHQGRYQNPLTLQKTENNFCAIHVVVTGILPRHAHTDPRTSFTKKLKVKAVKIRVQIRVAVVP